ncbi:hypothetical protein DFH94DRAFT_399652 [Russula ochroleuca]|uniref:Uncharacterized protein n=1 Tax=Russula ochroleuca TaxID=152965 RepID=A0A9P5MXX9_9AGAM|nr:hypothetical protein DFH94DRAFT_399652 [Russula ochroleuca]
MRSPDPTLPSITFVLSQARPATTARGSSTRRRGKLGVRRSKSPPSFVPGPHPPRYPPQLDSEFLNVRIPFPFHPTRADQENYINQSINRFDARKTVDYRFSDLPPPRAPSRSSFALPRDIFDTDTEIEIVAPSTESEPASTAGSSCSTASSSRSSRTRRQRAWTTAFMQGVTARV